MKLSDAEWQIMNALWKHHPATAREISERLPEGVDWAYTTIKTMLSRLKEKKAVSDDKQGNTSVYSPLVTQDQARKGAFRSLVSQAFEGAMGPLVHCLMDEKKLNKKQRQALMKILEEEDQ